MNYDQKIKFKLDGNWEGEGLVKAIYSHSVEVELTSDCKEFSKGCTILVDNKEIAN